MAKTTKFFFETSWEVCNKIGGIHTVITSKFHELTKEYGDEILFIGPDMLKGAGSDSEFIEDKTLFKEWRETILCEPIRVRAGYWNIKGKPKVLLVDFSQLILQKDEIFARLWETYKVDSITGQWDYIEAAMFGYAAGIAIKCFSDYYLGDTFVLAQFHEWMTAAGVLYLQQKAPHIATVFTTHATVLGRVYAGSGKPLYKDLGTFDAEDKAAELGVTAKHSLEKITSVVADVFTTVSNVTALECEVFFNNKPDFITPNGFDLNSVTTGIAKDVISNSRKVLCKVAETISGVKCNDDTLLVGMSGIYEFKNKGIDVYIDALGKLNSNDSLSNDIVAYILVPTKNYGPDKQLLQNIESGNTGNTDSLATHILDSNNVDSIIERCRKNGLNNSKDSRVKVVYVPVYLNGKDGIFNIPYYHLLSGLDVAVFPSYYEPWGYTPMESLAVGVPAITTNLSGFGQWMKQFSDSVVNGLGVISRTDDNYNEVVEKVESSVVLMSNKNISDREKVREKAQKLSKNTEWNKLINNYLKSYEKAFKASFLRIKNSKIKKTIHIKMDKRPISNEPVWNKMMIHSNLPKELKPLEEMSMNLWWCWNYEAIELFEEVSPQLWEKVQKNPITLLNNVTIDRFEELKKNSDFIDKLDRVYKAYKDYIGVPERTDVPKIAYFSMEYGISDTLKIFSGGLGILAGDYLKEASDCNVPMIGIGFLYKYGYFTQRLTVNGEQQASMEPQKFSDLPVTPVFDDLRQQITIPLSLPGRIVRAKLWKAMVGRVPLYLLDTDINENSPEDRSITHQLYGGDWENRLKQEMLLGLGGIRVIKALGLEPNVYHCNEGHAAMINIERMVDYVEHDKLTFEEALEVVRSSSLFTTHTPVPAGHDEFDEGLIRTYLRHIPESLKIDWDRFLNLGRWNEYNQGEKFSMSVLAAKTMQEMNGVSKLHGDVSKDMFNHLWRGYGAQELHISYVTNGVHYPTWTSKTWRKLYETEFGKDFLANQSDTKYWEKIFSIPDEKVWSMRNQLRKKLIDYVKERYENNFVRRHENPKIIMDLLNTVNENTLTIGFARRFATYKRAHLIFSDIERLAKIVNNPERPVQFLFAGKAHPQDQAGQDLIKYIVDISRRPEFVGKILFLENYDMELAKRLVRGVDIWLNNPTRPLEASGTSGQKAEMNGVLNFSVLDGWWVEGYKEKAGWALPEKRTYDNQDFQDDLDAATIYSMLEKDVIPLYYDRNEKDVPVEWVQYVKRSIAGIAPHFTTKRMLDDYIDRFYLKLNKRASELKKDNYKRAVEIAKWKANILSKWDSIEVVTVDFPNTLKSPFKMGEMYRGEVVLDIKELEDSDVGVELVFSLNNGEKIIDVMELEMTKRVDSLAFYEIKFELKQPGIFDYGLRIFPKNDLLPHRQDFALVKWI